MNELGTGLAQMKKLEELGALTPTSLKLPEDTTYERVEALFAYFGRVHGAVRWYIGDLCAFAEKRFDESTMTQAAAAAQLTEKTLLHYSRVAGRVSPARRRANLSFSIHAEVASLTPSLQNKWLKLAEENRWSVRDLRHLLRDEGVIEPPSSRPEWTPGLLDGEAGNGARGEPATGKSLPSETAPASPSSTEPWRSDLLKPIPPPIEHNPWVLARMRDELNEAIDGGRELDCGLFEERRDALTWALEQLAPELA